jgi:hypothetical protein
MSAVALTSYAGIPMTDVVPASAKLGGVSKSSILNGRRRIRFQPQTSTTATPGNITQFVLADSTCLLDVNSVVISFTATTTGTGAVALDDGPAWCRRIQITANGSLIEDTDNAHRNASAQVYLGADKGWVQGAGTFAGYWKDSPALASSGATYVSPGSVSSVGTYSLIEGDVKQGLTNASVRYKAGMSLAVPLGLLSGAMRGEQYWPLNHMGEIVFQFTLAQASEAVFQATGNTDGSYTLSDIFMEADLVTPSHAYSQVLNMLVNDDNEPGLVIPVETTITQQGQSISSGASVESSIVVSRATNNLRKVVLVAQPTAGLASANYPSVSCFPNNTFSQFQARTGSLYFPSQPANSLARAFWMSQEAFNGGEPLHAYNGVANWNTYGLTTATNLSLTSPSTYNVGQLIGNDKFVLAYNFDNFHGGERLEADGVSVLGNSGSQLICILRNSPGEAITPTVSLVATKYLHLKSGGLRIVGA